MTITEMTLTPVDRATLLAIVITSPTADPRDQILGRGMVDGVETSYAHLEIAAVRSSG